MAKRKKYIVYTLEVNQLERHRSFEIKLPSNVKKVSGVIITGAFREDAG